MRKNTEIRKIIRRMTKKRYNNQQIGDELGITRQRVWKIKKDEGLTK